MKTLQTRLQECINIRTQMRKYGIDDDPGTTKLKKDMVTFVQDGGRRFGVVRLDGGDHEHSGKSLQYDLTPYEAKDSFVHVRGR